MNLLHVSDECGVGGDIITHSWGEGGRGRVRGRGRGGGGGGKGRGRGRRKREREREREREGEEEEGEGERGRVLRLHAVDYGQGFIQWEYGGKLASKTDVRVLPTLVGSGWV